MLVITSHEDASAALKKGLKIVKTSNTNLINLVPALANGTSCLMAVPISIVFGFNEDTTIAVGPLSQSIYDSLVDISPIHNEWASLLEKFDPAAAATISANLVVFTKYRPRKDPNVSYSTTFLIGGNMYDEDHDVDKEELIEERLAAIIGDSTASRTASAEDKNQGPPRIADVLAADDLTLGIAAPMDKMQQYTIKHNWLYAMRINFNVKT